MASLVSLYIACTHHSQLFDFKIGSCATHRFHMRRRLQNESQETWVPWLHGPQLCIILRGTQMSKGVMSAPLQWRLLQ